MEIKQKILKAINSTQHLKMIFATTTHTRLRLLYCMTIQKRWNIWRHHTTSLRAYSHTLSQQLPRVGAECWQSIDMHSCICTTLPRDRRSSGTVT